jgi:hypothetical protein
MLGARKLHAAIVAFGFVMPGSLIASQQEDGCAGARNRVIQFLTNAHTGKMMKPEQWLTAEVRAAPSFNASGGLKALVEQSTERAKKYGGLASVTVREVKSQGQHCEVTAEVTFRRDHKEPGNPSAANEDMIWPFIMIKQHGVWKIAK